jgi:adenine-specific DNA-methyltransferase
MPSVIYKQSQVAVKYLRKLFGTKVFDNPKDHEILGRIIKYVTGSDDLVMDFFAGCGTTAEAVLEVNRTEGSNRRFILIQFAESVDETKPSGKNARKLGMDTIAEIAKERIRRAINHMQEQHQSKDGQLALELGADKDVGFKVFKLAPSTFHQWQTPAEENVEELADQLSFFDHGLVDGVSPQHVIYEVLLKEGYSLNAQIEELALAPAGNQVYQVTDESGAPFFYICLDGTIASETMDALRLERETTFVCLDTALDDSQKVNLAMQCQLKVI